MSLENCRSVEDVLAWLESYKVLGHGVRSYNAANKANRAAAIRRVEALTLERAAQAVKEEWDCAKKYDYQQPYTCTISGAFEMSVNAIRALAAQMTNEDVVV